MSKLAYISRTDRGQNIQKTFALKKIYLIKYNGRKLSFKILALKIELTAGATILKLRFGHLNMAI